MYRKKMYRAAVIGCGRIGSEFDEDPKRKMVSSHVGAYSAVPQTDLVAVADINEEKLHKCGKKWKIKSLYKNYEEMLRKENLDILSICTWSSTHLEILKKAVKYGVKAIFCEKPIATNLKGADEMVKICMENNVLFMIDHQRRFDPFHQKIKKFIDNRGLGKIQQVAFYYTVGIANTGSHMFDLLRFFFGEVDWVYGIYSENKSPNPEDPNVDGVLKFKNGIFCTMQSCDVRSFLIFEVDMIGTKGRMRITRSGFDLDFYNVKESKLFSGYSEIFRNKPPIDKDIPREFMVNAVKHIVDCLEKNKEPICSGIDGRKSLELICAFHESAKAGGKRIYLPLRKSTVEIKSK